MNEWMKQIVVHPYDGILFCNKKEQTTETCNSMDEFKKQYVEWYGHLQNLQTVRL